MATIFGPVRVGSVDLKPKESGSLSWDGPEEFERSTWSVTAIPQGRDPDGGVASEQRLEVVRMFFLRKGPDSADPDKLQLNFVVRNNGANRAKGYIIVSAIRP